MFLTCAIFVIGINICELMQLEFSMLQTPKAFYLFTNLFNGYKDEILP